MTPILENALLGTALDCGGFNLLNVGALEPVPPGMLHMDDPTLSDSRNMLPGSVTDSSVAATAAISQSKINWSVPPAGWIGTGNNQLAEGDLAEYAANKGIPNGYAPLDSNGLIPAAMIPHGAGTGSVTSVYLSILPGMFSVGSNNPTTTTGPWNVSWTPVPNKSILAVNGTTQFFVSALDASLISGLPASVFSTGKLSLSLLPFADYGTDHQQGIIPDPGVFVEPTSYLGRDMAYHSFSNNVPNQPTADPPQITVKFEQNADGSYTVVIHSTLAGGMLFYRLNGNPFAEAVQGTECPSDLSVKLTAHYGDIVEAYVAKQGYNNSPISVYQVTPPGG